MGKLDCIMFLSQARRWNQYEIELHSSFIIELFGSFHRIMLMYQKIENGIDTNFIRDFELVFRIWHPPPKEKKNKNKNNLLIKFL